MVSMDMRIQKYPWISSKKWFGYGYGYGCDFSSPRQVWTQLQSIGVSHVDPHRNPVGMGMEIPLPRQPCCAPGPDTVLL